MFRDDVVAHYAARGYKVHESVQLRGETGRVHACDLVAEGPLGNLVVTVRESGGGTELASLRAKGKDLSATPVLAVPEARPDVRRAAMQMGIVVLQEPDLVLPQETEAASGWPDGRAVPAWPEPKAAAPRPVAGLWSLPRAGETVQVEAPGGPVAPGELVPEPDEHVPEPNEQVARPGEQVARPVEPSVPPHGSAPPAPASRTPDAAPEDFHAPSHGSSWLDGLAGKAPMAPEQAGAPADAAPARPPVAPEGANSAGGAGGAGAARRGRPLRPREELVRLVDDIEEDDAVADDAAALPPRPALLSERRSRPVQRPERPAAAPRRRGASTRLTARHVAQAAIGGIVAGLVVIGLAVLLL